MGARALPAARGTLRTRRERGDSYTACARSAASRRASRCGSRDPSPRRLGRRSDRSATALSTARETAKQLVQQRRNEQLAKDDGRAHTQVAARAERWSLELRLPPPQGRRDLRRACVKRGAGFGERELRVVRCTRRAPRPSSRRETMRLTPDGLNASSSAALA